MTLQQFNQIKEPPIKNFLPLKLVTAEDAKEGNKGKTLVEKRKATNQMLILHSNRTKNTAMVVVVILIASALVIVLILLAYGKI